MHSSPMPSSKPSALPPYRKTELLFLHLFLRLLEIGGRCAAIVPDGVLFGSSTAHVETRKALIEMNRLDGVVSMPSGVFKPYAGVSTAILFFTKGAQTDRVWFYDMAHDGYSLGDKRQRVAESDLPDLLACWDRRKDPEFADARTARLAALRREIEPLKAARLGMQADIHRLTFEYAVAPEAEGAGGKEGAASGAPTQRGGTKTGGEGAHASGRAHVRVRPYVRSSTPEGFPFQNRPAFQCRMALGRGRTLRGGRTDLLGQGRGDELVDADALAPRPRRHPRVQRLRHPQGQLAAVGGLRGDLPRLRDGGDTLGQPPGDQGRQGSAQIGVGRLRRVAVPDGGISAQTGNAGGIAAPLAVGDRQDLDCIGQRQVIFQVFSPAGGWVRHGWKAPYSLLSPRSERSQWLRRFASNKTA